MEPANKAYEDSSAFRFCTGLSLSQDLGAVNATLQMIQKHLENKRTMFPRFCFFSNNRLLDFLAKARLRGRTDAPANADGEIIATAR
jgi:hypothetical protein